VVVVVTDMQAQRHWIITAYTARKLRGENTQVTPHLTCRYDKIGDILYIDGCLPYPEQESEEIGDEIIARINPVAGNIENLEVLFFSKRLQSELIFELPILTQWINLTPGPSPS